MACTSSADVDAAEPPEAMGLGGDGRVDDDDCPVLDLIKRHPELFEKEVLERLDPTDRAFLGQVDAACRAAVVASDLPCAGTRVGMRQLIPADRAWLARKVRAFTHHAGHWFREDRSRFETLGRVGYVESSVLPRAKGVVRLELEEFCTSAERLAWARGKGCRWDVFTCAYAARGGHLAALQWARMHGCRWDTTTCGAAAKGGHLEVLRWLREQGCPWGEWTCEAAARHGHLRCCDGRGSTTAGGIARRAAPPRSTGISMW